MHRVALIIVSGAVLVVSITSAAPPVVWTVQNKDLYAPDVAAAPDGGVTVGRYSSLTRYSNEGARVWRTTLPLSIASLQSDLAGNIYMVGGPASGGLMIRKHDSAGATLWSQVVGTPLTDFSPGFAVGADGTCYVTNSPWATNYGVPPPGTTTLLRQLLPDGTPGWTAKLDPGDGLYPGGPSSGHGTAVDKDGNIFSMFWNYRNINQSISGQSYLSKISATGQVQWIKPVEASDSLVIDQNNTLYVAAGSLYKYDSNGVLLWKVPSQVSNAAYSANCLGPDGTQYVAGYTYVNDQFAGIMAAYSSDGAELWSKVIRPPAGTTYLFMHGIALSGDQLVAAGQLTTIIDYVTYSSGNYIVALQIPEPSAVFSVLVCAPGLARSRKTRYKTAAKKSVQ